MYRSLAGDKLQFIETGDSIPLLQAADVILSDTSSVLTEFALLEKVVVAFNSHRPAPWMQNFTQPAQLQQMLEAALVPTKEVLANVKTYGDSCHPYRDGNSSERVVIAIDALVASGISHLKTKPLNLIRRFKIRKKLKYYRWA